MGMALQVMLLVVGIVVAVGGIGLALALRQLARQRKPRALARRMAHHRGAVPSQPGALGPAASRAMPLDAVRPGTPGAAAAVAAAAAGAAAAANDAPAAPLPAAATAATHDSKLQALQALLALGDARAEREPVSGFDDTQPVDEGYAATQFVDRRDNPPSQLSLLNLDKAARRNPGQRAR